MTNVPWRSKLLFTQLLLGFVTFLNFTCLIKTYLE